MTWRPLAPALALLLCGCPEDPPPVPEPAPKPAEQPDEQPDETPAAETPVTEATASAEVDGESEGDPPRREPRRTLILGSTQTVPLSTETSIGFNGVQTLPGPKGERVVARLSVGSGPVHYVAELAPTDRLRVGTGVLEATEISDEQVTLTWTEPPQAPLGDLVTDVDKGTRSFEPMGLYRFKSGAVIGVGNPLSLRKQDGKTATVISLTLFPPGYRGDPGQAYDVFPRLVAGKRVTGRTGIGLEVRGVSQDAVELRLGTAR